MSYTLAFTGVAGMLTLVYADNKIYAWLIGTVAAVVEVVVSTKS